MDSIVLNWVCMCLSFAVAMYVDETKYKIINFLCGIFNLLILLNHYKLV
jgi:hypothetical protein